MALNLSKRPENWALTAVWGEWHSPAYPGNSVSKWPIDLDS